MYKEHQEHVPHNWLADGWLPEWFILQKYIEVDFKFVSEVMTN